MQDCQLPGLQLEGVPGLRERFRLAVRSLPPRRPQENMHNLRQEFLPVRSWGMPTQAARLRFLPQVQVHSLRARTLPHHRFPMREGRARMHLQGRRMRFMH